MDVLTVNLNLTLLITPMALDIFWFITLICSFHPIKLFISIPKNFVEVTCFIVLLLSITICEQLDGT